MCSGWARPVEKAIRLSGKPNFRQRQSALDMHRITKLSSCWCSLSERLYWVQERTKMSSWLPPSKSLPSSRWGEKDPCSAIWEAPIWDYPWSGNPAPAFWLGKLHGRRCGGLQPMGSQRVRQDPVTKELKWKSGRLERNPLPCPPLPARPRTGSCGGVRLEYKRRGTSLKERRAFQAFSVPDFRWWTA